MRRTVAALVLLLLTAGTAWLAIALLDPPAVAPASAPADVFSAERAMAHVNALAGSGVPRPVGSEAHAAAREYIVGELKALGLETEVWTGVGRSSRGMTYGTMEDVIARVPGTGGDGTLLLMAHYDSAKAGPGASDDAVGVATLLESLRALLAGPAPSNDVVALFSDGEELGLLGAEAFAEGHPLGRAVDLVINFEARGTRGPALMFETGPGNGWTIARFAEAAPYPVAASYSYEVYRRLPNDTDYSVFKGRGVPGLNFAHIHGPVGYHTALDSVEHMDPRSLQHHGSNALGLARALGSADLSAAGTGGDAVYFNPLGSFFVHFPASWVIALFVILALAVVGVVGAGFARGRVRLGGVVLGLVGQVVILVVLGGLAFVLRGLLFRGGYDFRIWGDASSLAFILFALTLLALGLGLVLQGLLARLGARFLQGEDLAVAGLVLWLLATGAVSLVAPGASYLFLVPLVFQAIAVGLLVARAERSGETASVSAALVAALAVALVVTALVWAPTLALVAVGLRAAAAAIVAVASGLLLALLAPQAEIVAAQKPRWAVPGLLVVLGLVLIVAVRLSGGFGPENPRYSSLFYGLDLDSGEAVWASFQQRPDAWSGKVLPERPEVRPLPELLPWPRPVAVAPAPVLERSGPELQVLERPDSGEGTVRLRIVPPAGADRIRLFLEPRDGIDAVAVASREPQPVDAGNGPVVVHYVAPPADGIELAVESSDPSALQVTAIAQWWALPSDAEGGPGVRPAELMVAPFFWDTDTTMVRRHWVVADVADAVMESDSASEDGDGAEAGVEGRQEVAVK